MYKYLSPVVLATHNKYFSVYFSVFCVVATVNTTENFFLRKTLLRYLMNVDEVPVIDFRLEVEKIARSFVGSQFENGMCIYYRTIGKIICYNLRYL